MKFLVGCVMVLLAGCSSWVKVATPGQSPVVFLRTGESTVVSTQSGHSANWVRARPTLRAFDNIKHPPLDLISYRAEFLGRGTQQTIHAREPGTFYVGATKDRGFRIRATGEPLHRKFPGEFVQIVVRRNDTYIGYLEELFGTPFIMGPGVTESHFHQTDQRVGSDCAAFATYGQRRMRKNVTYAGPEGIRQFLQPLRDGLTPGADGVYRDANGLRFPIGTGGLQEGDIVHFGPQVSVFYADGGVRGWLDTKDLLIQSWRNTPCVTTIWDSGFVRYPVGLYRWRK